MSGNRFGGIGDRLLERVSGGDAAGQVGKAHAVARAFVLVYQCDVACHRLTAFAAIEPAYRLISASSDASPYAVRQRDLARFRRMLEMMVTSARPDEIPAIRLKLPNDTTRILSHLTLLARSRPTLWCPPHTASITVTRPYFHLHNCGDACPARSTP